jgi:hypothetical protein
MNAGDSLEVFEALAKSGDSHRILLTYRRNPVRHDKKEARSAATIDASGSP